MSITFIDSRILYFLTTYSSEVYLSTAISS